MKARKWYRYCPKCQTIGRANGTRPSTQDWSIRVYDCPDPKCGHSWDAHIIPARVVKVVSKLESSSVIIDDSEA
jgi:hypothetical protein